MDATDSACFRLQNIYNIGFPERYADGAAEPMRPMEPMEPMRPMRPMEPMRPMQPMLRWAGVLLTG